MDIVKQHLISDEDYPINEKYGEVEESPLMFACYNGHLDIVRTLCEYPANIYAINANYENCMHFACVGGHTNVVEYLLAFAREVRSTANDASDGIDTCSLSCFPAPS